MRDIQVKTKKTAAGKLQRQNVNIKTYIFRDHFLRNCFRFLVTVYGDLADLYLGHSK